MSVEGENGKPPGWYLKSVLSSVEALHFVQGVDPATAQWMVKAAAEAPDAAHLYLYGVIAEWDINAQELIEALGEVDADEIVVHIKSPGGDARTGVAIYNALRDHPSAITTKNDALAASAASIIFMAGDTRIMNRASELMIHKASTFVSGNADDLRSVADMLDKVNTNMAGVYTARAGGTEDGWLEAMAATTWYTGAEAVEAGLAHSQVTDSNDDEDDDPEASSDVTVRLVRTVYVEADTIVRPDDAPAPYIPGATNDSGDADDPEPGSLAALVNSWDTSTPTETNPFAGMVAS